MRTDIYRILLATDKIKDLFDVLRHAIYLGVLWGLVAFPKRWLIAAGHDSLVAQLLWGPVLVAAIAFSVLALCHCAGAIGKFFVHVLPDVAWMESSEKLPWWWIEMEPRLPGNSGRVLTIKWIVRLYVVFGVFTISVASSSLVIVLALIAKA